jgi:hypothetical protein
MVMDDGMIDDDALRLSITTRLLQYHQTRIHIYIYTYIHTYIHTMQRIPAVHLSLSLSLSRFPPANPLHSTTVQYSIVQYSTVQRMASHGIAHKKRHPSVSAYDRGLK